MLAAAAIGFLAGSAIAQDKPAEAGVAPQTQKINDLLSQAWKANNLKASARASDSEFLRRVYLDLIGRIATPKEVLAFESDRGPNRRARLVQKLLYEKNYAEEYARNWSNIWTVWLLTRTGNPVYRAQMQTWLEEHFARDRSYKDMVVGLLTAKGKTNDNGAVNYVLQHLGEAVPKNEQERDGKFDMVPLTSRTTRLFLGLQTQCVQCHDHPFNPEWKQQNFWSVNVYFRQVERVGQPNMMRGNQDATVLELRDTDKVNTEGLIPYEKRSGVVLYTKGRFLDRDKVLDLNAPETRREQLAGFITGDEQFSRAFVNRIWGHLFGRGMNEQPAVDDFGDHNKVVHPELLNYLAAEFAGETSAYEFNRYNAFDPKKLLYWICTSDAYNLTSAASPTNDKPELDVFFSRMLLKALSPEQLFESLTTATEGQSASYSKERQDRRDAWMRQLVQNFGDDEGNEVSFNGTLLQALMMMNGRELGDAIRNKDRGTVAEAMRRGRSAAKIIDELFLASLNRHAQSHEISKILAAGTKYRDAVSPAFYGDVFWALLNSNEFMLNH
ncbi:MAG: DUF1549 domain-containing protein [Acidobacteria bacterium]|nr:DUF1549 domain-containing protein [Acidobacteriota bacterium]